MTCSNGDNAFAHDITYENISIEYDDQIPTPIIQKNDAEIYQNINPSYTPRLVDVGVYYFPEYSRGVLERGKNHNIIFKNIKLFANENQKIKVRVLGFDDEHKSSNIILDNLQFNGRKITDTQEIDLVVNEFCENVELK